MYKIIKTDLDTVRESTGPIVRDSAALARLCSDFADLQQESFHVFLLNSKNRVIARRLVALGTINSAPVAPSDVFRAAIREGAVSIVVAHNHPSGDCNPSAEDRELTEKLKEGGKLLGVPVLDHVIVGPGGDWQSIVYR